MNTKELDDKRAMLFGELGTGEQKWERIKKACFAARDKWVLGEIEKIPLQPCTDKHHDDRWCSHCNSREMGQDELKDDIRRILKGGDMDKEQDDRPRISDDVAKEVDIKNTISDEYEKIARIIYAHSKYLCQSNALTIVNELLKKYYIIPKDSSPDKWVERTVESCEIDGVIYEEGKLKWR